ncbi:hypothetical protein AQUCO_01100062v1 [Aquilegia coerulea]|uniref:Pollen Ole e 1 allergen and extensin family protein n=1 Tax=Aquilegia coerulea TaxID=218851 RepID=A0A2G5E5J5_AQUCA|nr:hypothetical protein AQUCO_01100062v1 [Aquilegia coerulea]
MDLRIVLILLCLCTHSLCKEVVHPSRSTSNITVMGFVYCDICSNNTFTRHSYFLPGVKVHINCKFNAISATTTEQISFSVNRTTDKYGIYKMEIPSVEGIECAEGVSVQSSCEARLITSSSSSCNVPGLTTTSDQSAFKLKQDNVCFYSLNALNYRPPGRDVSLCGKYKEGISDSINSAKFFLPYYPPYGFPWPPFPQFPPFPNFPFPPFQSFPFPPLPPFPSFPFPPISFPQPPPPSLPFPFPPLPHLPPLPPLTQSPPSFSLPPPPPSFNLGDPRTWTPYIPPFSPLPQTPPFLSPSPPPTFNLRDPRTWIPFIPPSSPNQPQDKIP